MKFIMAKNVLAMAVTGALLCYSVGVMAEESFNVDGYEVTLYDNGAAVISKGNDVNLINTITGANTGRIVPNDSITRAILAAPENARHIVAQDLLTYPIYSDALKAENIRNIKAEDIKSIVDTKESLQKIIKPENKDDYIAAVNAGGTAEDFIKISNTTSGLSSLYKNVVEGQNFVLDSSGRITADGRADGNAQTVPVKEFVVELDNRTRNLGVEVKSQGDSLRGEIGGVYRDARAHTDSQVTAVRDELKAEGDSLRGEIGGVYRDARAHTDSQVTAVRDELKAEGDSLRGEIGGVYRDARAHTDSQVTAVRDELKAEGDSLRGEIGGVYRDARAHTDSQVTAVRDELSRDIIAVTSAAVAQTDAAIASNTAAIRNNSHRLDLTEAWQKMATERMNNMQEQIKENRKELRESAAQSAALAGLFQPYSVGKFNATAAVGGYRDEQAIAVGVGYRFTENVAGKVAVAAGGSSASWNAGVNFEF
ncbi:TPA: YadA-like family protein [Escherichia coli]|uniref:Putative immunoglobuling-binding protein n=1 Tax=Escherichia coli TaxID=562 RepID=A0A376MWA2_ECOLX|nr:YadA C-terminal domain-containing protein [Escherichia coli]WIX67747.1 YadA C-terminal domain-containing protein [Escherichia coli]STG54691.1 putative immunoglobuling-binding protein [Escherichia coli]